MANYNLQGRWTSDIGKHFEMNIVMTSATDFNIKAITAELQLEHWEAGYGQVFELGKVHAVFNHRHKPDMEVSGFVTADGKTINWNNGTSWRRS